MGNITSFDYFAEVESMAVALAEEAMQQCDNDRSEAEDMINDTLLFEAVDGHQWIIYYDYNLEIYKRSNNADYYIDNFGTDEAGEAIKNNGLHGLHQAIAFWAFYGDIQDRIQSALDQAESALEEEEEGEE